MRAVVVLLLKLAGAGFAFALLFQFVHFDQVRLTLRTADPILVAAGVIIFLIGQVVAAARWRLILQKGGVSVPLRGTLRMNLIGTFAGNFLPGMATGDIAKSALLFGDFPEKRSFLVASVVYDRLSGLAAILALMLLGALLLGVMSDEWGFAGYSALIAAFFVLLLWVIAADSGSAYLLRMLPKMLVTRCSVFMSELQMLLHTRRLLRTGLVFSLLFQLSWIVSQWLMLCALFPHAPFVPVLVASTFSLLVALMPVSLNGLGLREGSFSYVLQHFDIEPQLAVAAALLSLLPILVSSLIGGVLLALRGRCCETGISDR